ncbi:MAG: sigma 54-interacting transcriptional regulator [Deltaproteobacteria bacterium]|nr:sigma 54-interacting transcriptional regulator [Deltaproteobacteria bacterium]
MTISLSRLTTKQRVFDIVKKVAATDLTVLITGESGTGKELIANALHQNSRAAAERLLAGQRARTQKRDRSGGSPCHRTRDPSWRSAPQPIDTHARVHRSRNFQGSQTARSRSVRARLHQPCLAPPPG